LIEIIKKTTLKRRASLIWRRWRRRWRRSRFPPLGYRSKKKLNENIRISGSLW